MEDFLYIKSHTKNPFCCVHRVGQHVQGEALWSSDTCKGPRIKERNLKHNAAELKAVVPNLSGFVDRRERGKRNCFRASSRDGGRACRSHKWSFTHTRESPPFAKMELRAQLPLVRPDSERASAQRPDISVSKYPRTLPSICKLLNSTD